MITNHGLGIVTDKPLPERRPSDYYPTDLATVRRVLSRYQDMATGDRRYQYPRRVLDPGAGCGHWGQVARDLWPLAHLTGCEIRTVPRHADYDEWLTGDFVDLYRGLFPSYHLIMGNPPFNQAEAFVRTALPVLHPGGHLVFLLRLAFLEGQRRRDGLFREFPPKEVWVASKRPSFTLDGKTNATAFGIFVWQKEWWGSTGLSWLK